MSFLDRLFCPNRWLPECNRQYLRDINRIVLIDEVMATEWRSMSVDLYHSLATERFNLESKWGLI